ncbi:hypothetical protein YSY22_48000 [Brevibacillus formosus]
MTDFVSLILIALPLLSWGFIVNSQSLRKRWLYVLFTFIIFWGIVGLDYYFDPPSPHYE